MKIKHLLVGICATSLLMTTSCNDDNNETFISKGAYEGGIFVGVEGSIKDNNAEVSYLPVDQSQKPIENIYALNNADKPLGDVLQTIAFKDEKAYLVINNSNKIEVVNRYSFKNMATINSSQPRGIAFANNNIYVSSNNFFNTYKVDIYDEATNAAITSIALPRYAEKIVSVGNYVVVQSDGSKYIPQEAPTGHTITTIDAKTNTIAKTITLTDDGIIRDVVASNGFAYVLTGDKKDSYIYEINPSTGAFTTSKLSGIANASLLRSSGNLLYFVDDQRNVYSKPTASASAATKLFTSEKMDNYYIYGFDIIDSKVFISNTNFINPSKVTVYSLQGTVLNKLTLGKGVNGFYKN